MLIKQGQQLNPGQVGENLKAFYGKVDSYNDYYDTSLFADDLKIVGDYTKAASSATNDRGSRIKRGEIIRKVILGNY